MFQIHSIKGEEGKRTYVKVIQRSRQAETFGRTTFRRTNSAYTPKPGTLKARGFKITITDLTFEHKTQSLLENQVTKLQLSNC